MRITDAWLRKRFVYAAKKLGWLIGVNQVGAFSLDKNVGGYRIARIISVTGAERDISDRLSAREMSTFIDGMLAVHRVSAEAEAGQ